LTLVEESSTAETSIPQFNFDFDEDNTAAADYEAID
jgi:molecular chaperone DnaK